MAYITNMAELLFIRVADKSYARTYDEIVEEILGKYGSFYLGISMSITLLLGNAHLQVVSSILYEIIL